MISAKTMGRYYLEKKDEADYLIRISANFLSQHNYFRRNQSGTITWTNGFSDSKSSVGVEVLVVSGSKYLRIHYTQTNHSGEKQDFDYKVLLTETACNFGGKRYWFSCPLTVKGKY